MRGSSQRSILLFLLCSYEVSATTGGAGVDQKCHRFSRLYHTYTASALALSTGTGRYARLLAELGISWGYGETKNGAGD